MFGFHFPVFKSMSGTVTGSGVRLNKYYCSRCGSKWVATKKHTFFKHYVKTFKEKNWIAPKLWWRVKSGDRVISMGDKKALVHIPTKAEKEAKLQMPWYKRLVFSIFGWN